MLDAYGIETLIADAICERLPSFPNFDFAIFFPAFTPSPVPISPSAPLRSSSAQLLRVSFCGAEEPYRIFPRSLEPLPIALVGQARSPRRADLDASVRGFQLRLRSCTCCSDETLRTQSLGHGTEVHTIGAVDNVHHREHRERESPSEMGSHRVDH